MQAEVRFIPTVEDLVDGQRLWLRTYWKRPLAKVLLVLISLLWIGQIAGVITALVTDQPSLLGIASDMIWTLLFTTLFLGLQIWAWVRVPSRIRIMVQQQPSMLGETSWRWNDAGADVSSPAGSSVIKWSELHRWLIGKGSVVLMPQEKLLLILPRRVLSAEQDLSLRGMVDQFAGRKRRL